MSCKDFGTLFLGLREIILPGALSGAGTILLSSIKVVRQVEVRHQETHAFLYSYYQCFYLMVPHVALDTS